MEDAVTHCGETDPFARVTRLRVPCGDCPWRRDGAIELMPGRLQGIAQGLLARDDSAFFCHKLLSGDRLDEACDEEEKKPSGYVSGDKDAMCAGAIAFQLKADRPPVMLRVAFALGASKPSDWDEAKAMVVDPEDVLPLRA